MTPKTFPVPSALAGNFTVPLAQKRGFLNEEGIETEIVTISGPVANIALASGEIDYFTGFGSAMRAVIQGQLPARIVVLARAEDLFAYPISGLVAHTNKIKDKPDEIKRLIRAGIKANRYMRQNRDGTIPVLMSTYKLDKEVAISLYDSFVKGFSDDGNPPEDGFRQLIEDTKSVTQIRREVAFEVAFNEVSDLSILKEAQRELGITVK
jgi:ABC-type nitrate/sulfonate/bicarbonate transport system substrate-binding protein